MKDSEQHVPTSMKVLAVAAFFAIFGLVGAMDQQDELNEAEHYEEMVCNGHWPNYKGIEVNCEQ